MRSLLWCVALMAALGSVFVSNVQAAEKAVPLDKLPKAVTDAVKKMFPKAEMLEAIQEEEDGKIGYEVTVKENGKKIDITVEADGEIELLEKEVDLKDLPKAVTATLEKMYPKAVLKSAEAVFDVDDGKEELEFYEVQLKTADGKELEAKIKADGTIVKDDPKQADPKDKK